jgi:hypothetical protein
MKKYNLILIATLLTLLVTLPTLAQGRISTKGTTKLGIEAIIKAITSADAEKYFDQLERTDATNNTTLVEASFTSGDREIRLRYTSAGMCKNLRFYISPVEVLRSATERQETVVSDEGLDGLANHGWISGPAAESKFFANRLPTCWIGSVQTEYQSYWQKQLDDIVAETVSHMAKVRPRQ